MHETAKNALALIPARGGSKGIPRKNIVPFAGKPLIAWTIEAARQSGRFTDIVVSTDDAEIAAVSQAFGAEVLNRPADLSGDLVGSLPVVLHVLEHYPTDIVALLQPTSPLRTADDIKAALDLHRSTARPVVSIYRAKPWLFNMAKDGTLSAALAIADQRQAAHYYAPNGAIYVASASRLQDGETWWDNAVGYEMPPERSTDIDALSDLTIAESLFRQTVTQLTREEAEAMCP